MTREAISPLRQRMIEDMTLCNFAPRTQEAYIRAVTRFATFLGRSPDQGTAEDVRRFQLHLAGSGMSIGNMNRTMTGLGFLLRVTLKRPQIAAQIQFAREPKTLPLVLSRQEVSRLLQAAPGLKARAALSVAYGAGLRASEVVSLKVSDIDSAQMVIRVEQGKGGKDRYVMLSPDLLALLRQWWKTARPQGWLFPGRDRINPLTTRQLSRLCRMAAQAAEIEKNVTLHTLRHSFATHLLERKIDIRLIQALLGHKKLDTTAHYTRVATEMIREVVSPLDHLERSARKTEPAA
ncbi:MAG: site-specific integrase [Hyphomicrobium sp.]